MTAISKQCTTVSKINNIIKMNDKKIKTHDLRMSEFLKSN